METNQLKQKIAMVIETASINWNKFADKQRNLINDYEKLLKIMKHTYSSKWKGVV